MIRAAIGSAVLAGAACAAHAQSYLDVLPAAPDAWHIQVLDGDRGAELKGDSVVVPHAGATTHSSHGARDAVLFDWKDRWEATLRFESAQPLDLRPFVAHGTLEFDLDVADLVHGGVRVKMSCGDGCEPSVNLPGQGRGWVGKGWQHVAVPLGCFAHEGADFSHVKLPFGLAGVGSGRVSVANVRIVRDGKSNTSCPDYRTQSVTPVPQDEWFALDWWMPRHQEKLEEKRKLLAAGTPPEIVFIGDSITNYWEGAGREVWQRHYAQYHALNLGFGGDQTQHVLWRLQHGEIDGISPKVTVLMIGTNNTGFRAEDPRLIAAGIRRIVDEIHQRMPHTQVLLLAIFPRGEKPDDPLRLINDRVNRQIAGWNDVHFLDIGASFLSPDGTLSKDIMPDLLHPNDKGYAIWQRAMEPTLQKLLDDGR